jgi:hypothetical protein
MCFFGCGYLSLAPARSLLPAMMQEENMRSENKQLEKGLRDERKKLLRDWFTTHENLLLDYENLGLMSDSGKPLIISRGA